MVGDIIIFSILLIMTVIGYRKGFLKTLTGLVSVILAFVLAVSFSAKVEEYIKTTPVYDAIYENLEESIVSEKNETKETEKVSIQKLNMPKQMIKNIQEDIEEETTELKKTMTAKIVDTAVKILSIILIFIAARIIIWLVLLAVGVIHKLPFIGWFDRLLGAFFGFLRGFIVVYLILAVVMILSAFNSENPFVKTINHSEFAKVMYNNNVFFDFLEND